MKRSFLLLTLLFHLTLAYSQNKSEREYRIKSSEVPAKALEYVESNFQDVRMKWYGEENLDGKAVEAKGKKQGNLYSVKFETFFEHWVVSQLLSGQLSFIVQNQPQGKS